MANECNHVILGSSYDKLPPEASVQDDPTRSRRRISSSTYRVGIDRIEHASIRHCSTRYAICLVGRR